MSNNKSVFSSFKKEQKLFESWRGYLLNEEKEKATTATTNQSIDTDQDVEPARAEGGYTDVATGLEVEAGDVIPGEQLGDVKTMDVVAKPKKRRKKKRKPKQEKIKLRKYPAKEKKKKRVQPAWMKKGLAKARSVTGKALKQAGQEGVEAAGYEELKRAEAKKAGKAYRNPGQRMKDKAARELGLDEGLDLNFIVQEVFKRLTK